jgi:hypothetical protein
MRGDAGWREPLPGSGVTGGVTEVVAAGSAVDESRMPSEEKRPSCPAVWLWGVLSWVTRRAGGLAVVRTRSLHGHSSGV